MPAFLEVPPAIDIGSRAQAKEPGSRERRIENQQADGKLAVSGVVGAPGEPQVGANLPALPADPLSGLPSSAPVNHVRDRIPGTKADESLDGEEIAEGDIRDDDLQATEEGK